MMRTTTTTKFTTLAAAALLGTTAAAGMTSPAHADPAPGTTMNDLNNAQLPSTCDLPAGAHLTNGTYDGGPGKPHAKLGERLTFPDIDHDGVKDGVAAISCDAGNVTWPDALVVVGPGGKLKGWLDLGKELHAAKGHVTAVSVTDSGQVQIAFQSSDAGAPQTFTRGDVNWTDTGPVLVKQKDEFGDAPLDFNGIGPIQFQNATQSQLTKDGLGKDYGSSRQGCINFGAAGPAADLQLHYTFDADGKLSSVSTYSGFVHTSNGEVARVTTADQVRANWGTSKVIERDTVVGDGLPPQPSLVVQQDGRELIFTLDKDRKQVTQIVAHASTGSTVADFHGANCTTK